MKQAIAQLKSTTPYSQSKYYSVPKLERELHKDYEARTWRERCHYDDNRQLYIPPMAFKNCLSDAAKYLSLQIPGKGKSTYTKHFEAGILVMDPLPLPIVVDEVPGEWVYVPSDGRRGGTTRVEKCFPVIKSWAGQVNIFVIDEIITLDVLKQHLDMAGQLIGIGRFRPRNNGFYGRFTVEDIAMV